MSKFFQNRFFLLLALIFVIGCTNVDNFFGNEFIPPSQDMDTYIDSSMRVRTSIIKMDSMPGRISGIARIGSEIDPMVGRTTVGFFSTYLPRPFNNNDSLFGVNPVLDSMKLFLTFTSHLGDTVQGVRVSLYEVKDTVFRYAQTYYMNMNPELYYDSSVPPIAEFEVHGQNRFSAKLPSSFFNKFLASPPTNEADKKINPYYNDSIFVSQFKGLYFRATPITSGEGQITKVDIDDGSSSLMLYYHNSNPSKFDTTYQEYILYNSKALYTIGTQVVSHDYSFANQSLGGVNPATINDTTFEAKTVYVQGLNGLGVRVVLDASQLTKIKQMAAEKGFSSVAVHKAVLKWRTKEQSALNYDRSFSQLGLYYSMFGLDFIADYDPIRDVDLENNNTSPLGGYLNRSTGYYVQDITSTIQKMISGKVTRNALEMYPFAGPSYYSPARTILEGSKSDMMVPQIIITYTLLR